MCIEKRNVEIIIHETEAEFMFWDEKLWTSDRYGIWPSNLFGFYTTFVSALVSTIISKRSESAAVAPASKYSWMIGHSSPTGT